jgi:branched-chain amino acid transport system substrate-binding protein
LTASTPKADELGKEARGVVISQVMPHPFSYGTPIATEFQKAVQAQADTNKVLTVNYSSMEGFVAARVFTQALRLTGKQATQEAFLNALEGIQNAQFGGFSVDFNSAKHTGSKFVDMTILSGDGHVLH